MKFSSFGGARLTKPTPLGSRNPPPRHPSLAGARAATVQAAAHSVAPRPSAASRAAALHRLCLCLRRVPPPLRRHRSGGRRAPRRRRGEPHHEPPCRAVPRREPPCREVRRRQSCARRAAATPSAGSSQLACWALLGLAGRPGYFFYFFVN